MKKLFEDSKLIEEYAKTLGGVFLFSELATLFAEPHKTEIFRRIKRLEDLGIIQRFMKGVYTTKDFSLAILNQKICPQSYLSFGTILSENLIIGMTPKYQIDAVKVGKTRVYKGKQGTIRQFGCAEHLLFGFHNQGGVNKATVEKAILDTFYFHQHGIAFPFDIYSDIDWRRIDGTIIETYLQEYRNPKFSKFVEGVMNAAA